VKVSVSIDVPSLADGIRFYGRAFAFVESSRPHERYAVLVAGDARIGLLSKSAGSSPARDCADVRRYDRYRTPVHIDFNVDDFDSTLENAVEAGCQMRATASDRRLSPVAFCGGTRLETTSAPSVDKIEPDGARSVVRGTLRGT
jgi:predicted enzyme related to lactoylglutathione lyase